MCEQLRSVGSVPFDRQGIETVQPHNDTFTSQDTDEVG